MRDEKRKKLQIMRE